MLMERPLNGSPAVTLKKTDSEAAFRSGNGYGIFPSMHRYLLLINHSYPLLLGLWEKGSWKKRKPEHSSDDACEWIA